MRPNCQAESRTLQAGPVSRKHQPQRDSWSLRHRGGVHNILKAAAETGASTDRGASTRLGEAPLNGAVCLAVIGHSRPGRVPKVATNQGPQSGLVLSQKNGRRTRTARSALVSRLTATLARSLSLQTWEAVKAMKRANTMRISTSPGTCGHPCCSTCRC